MLLLLEVDPAHGVQPSGVSPLYMPRPVEHLNIAEEWDSTLTTNHVSDASCENILNAIFEYYLI
jgi:hypothetical protein